MPEARERPEGFKPRKGKAPRVREATEADSDWFCLPHGISVFVDWIDHLFPPVSLEVIWFWLNLDGSADQVGQNLQIITRFKRQLICLLDQNSHTCGLPPSQEADWWFGKWVQYYYDRYGIICTIMKAWKSDGFQVLQEVGWTWTLDDFGWFCCPLIQVIPGDGRFMASCMPPLMIRFRLGSGCSASQWYRAR